LNPEIGKEKKEKGKDVLLYWLETYMAMNFMSLLM